MRIDDEDGKAEYTVSGVLKHKWLFKARPEHFVDKEMRGKVFSNIRIIGLMKD